MRLIDADELIEHAWRDKLDSRELIAEMIEKAPTIKKIPTKIPIDVFEKLISQESRMGYWFVDERPESDREIICSNCEQPIFKYHKMDFDYRPKYCPNCGARMESEE